MPVFECHACTQAPCNLFILDPDCDRPTFCPWMGKEPEPEYPQWQEMKVCGEIE